MQDGKKSQFVKLRMVKIAKNKTQDGKKSQFFRGQNDKNCKKHKNMWKSQSYKCLECHKCKI